ncbi:MAG: hypothetical protein PCFJNLEI_04224 [Verrucomicrobiae bacterium]|nr:hypothetical protein [Verrucomicrobiae bacterium]
MLANTMPLLTVTELVPTANKLARVNMPPPVLSINTGPANVFDPRRIRLNAPCFVNCALVPAALVMLLASVTVPTPVPRTVKLVAKTSALLITNAP